MKVETKPLTAKMTAESFLIGKVIVDGETIINILIDKKWQNVTDNEFLHQKLDEFLEVDIKCECCGGTGIVFGEHTDNKEFCRTCGGSGKLGSEPVKKDTCGNCHWESDCRSMKRTVCDNFKAKTVAEKNATRQEN